MRSSYRAFILRVIQRYRHHQCLWRTGHKDYRNKAKRNNALDDIVKIFRTKDPSANRQTAQRKLQSLRAAYDNELRKVRSSEVNYVPKLWYYKHLTFLEEQNLPQGSSATSTVPHEGSAHETFGKYVAEKLRSIPAPMVPYCQKLINEAVFLAEIGSLDATSRITDDRHGTETPGTRVLETYSDLEVKYRIPD